MHCMWVPDAGTAGAAALWRLLWQHSAAILADRVVHYGAILMQIEAKSS